MCLLSVRVFALLALAAVTAADTVVTLRGHDGGAIQPSALDSKVTAAMQNMGNMARFKLEHAHEVKGVGFSVDEVAQTLTMDLSNHEQPGQKTGMDKTEGDTVKNMEISLSVTVGLTDGDLEFDFGIKFASTFSEMFPTLSAEIIAAVNTALCTNEQCTTEDGSPMKTLQDASNAWQQNEDDSAALAFQNSHPILAMLLGKFEAGLTFETTLDDGKTFSASLMMLDKDNQVDGKMLPSLKSTFAVDDSVGCCITLVSLPNFLGYSPAYCGWKNQGVSIGFKLNGFSQSSFIAAIWPLILPADKTITDYINTGEGAKAAVMLLATDIKTTLEAKIEDPVQIIRGIMQAGLAALSNPSITAEIVVMLGLGTVKIEQTVEFADIIGGGG